MNENGGNSLQAVTATDKHQLHDRLQTLLADAHAASCHIVGTFLDIRGFSTYLERGDSFDAAFYLRSAYTQILENYFPDRDFFKPTGDGLLLVHELPPDSSKWPGFVTSILSRSLELVRSFQDLTGDDLAAPSEVPGLLGIGVAIGPATRLVSDGQVLDYTGRCLNLAARLMDKARPSGVVFSNPRAEKFIGEELAGSFRQESVFIRGIAEDVPIGIVVSAGVQIDPLDRHRRPGQTITWGVIQSVHFSDVRRFANRACRLPRPPFPTEAVKVRVVYPVFSNGQLDYQARLDLDGTVEEDQFGFLVWISMAEVKRVIDGSPDTVVGVLRTKKNAVTLQAYLAPVPAPAGS
jgi:class 3 adenylate cyclase